MIYSIHEETIQKIGDAIRDLLGTSEKYNPIHMDQAIRSADVVFDLPNYWRSYLDSKIDQIKTKITNSTKTTAIFGYFSDSHILYESQQAEGNAGHTGEIIRYLCFKGPVRTWIFGGDVLAYENTSALCQSSFDTVSGWLSRIEKKIVVKGNHDLNPYGSPNLSDSQYRSMFFDALEPNAEMPYYYVDDIKSKTRFIVVDTRETSINESYTNGDATEKAYVATEVEWIYSTLNSTPTGYQIVMLPHTIWWGGGRMAEGHLTLSDSGTDLVSLCGSYNSRSSGTQWGKSYNFASGVGIVALVLSGHTHIDYSRTYNNVPAVSITSDSYAYGNKRPDSRPHTKGTTSEHALDIWFVDTANGSAETIRIGVGPDRLFAVGSASNGQICKVTKTLTNCTINNAATTAKGTYSATITATSGDFVNGNYSILVNGYNMNTACCTLSNSNQTLAVSINPLVGDVDIVAEAATVQTYTITKNLTHCSGSNAAASIIRGSSYSNTITADSGYDMSTITVTMGGVDITSSAVSNNIITIASVTGAIVITALAEEIVSYTNQIRISQALDSTAIYNNGLGYKNGYYTSQGNESANANDCCTGLIPYVISADTQPTDVLYIKGYTAGMSESHTRLSLWTPTKTHKNEYNGFLSSTSTPYDVETLGTNYYKLTPKSRAHHSWNNVGFVRFSFHQPDASTIIITKNEPIG